MVAVGRPRLRAADGRFLPDDPPGKNAVAKAADEAERQLGDRSADAAGRSQPAGRRGRFVSSSGLSSALTSSRPRPAVRQALLARAFEGVRDRPGRARTLAAGAVLLTAVQRRLSVPLVVARTGLREGAVLELLSEQQAA